MRRSMRHGSWVARATGLVNAVLRRFVSERAALLGRVDEDLAVAPPTPPGS